MFDIGATELLLVAIIGLVVVGPERLPRLARSVGLWVKKLRGQVSSIQQDINRELELEDLKRQLEARGGGLKMEDITGSDPLGLDQTTSKTTTTEKNERSKPE
ncbi:Sec-independent protein translocase protein TatB [Litoricolaceae bacterium]|nr:Sec-independent protein translocase protein TatB [Litorivicinaceae bacterium]